MSGDWIIEAPVPNTSPNQVTSGIHIQFAGLPSGRSTAIYGSEIRLPHRRHDLPAGHAPLAAVPDGLDPHEPAIAPWFEFDFPLGPTDDLVDTRTVPVTRRS